MAKHPQDEIMQLVLPPRRPKGDKRNARRAEIVMAFAHQKMVKTRGPEWRAAHKREKCKLCRVRVKFRKGAK